MTQEVRSGMTLDSVLDSTSLCYFDLVVPSTDNSAFDYTSSRYESVFADDFTSLRYNFILSSASLHYDPTFDCVK